MYDRKVVSGISASVLFIGFVVVVRRCVGFSTTLAYASKLHLDPPMTGRACNSVCQNTKLGKGGSVIFSVSVALS